MGDSFVFDLARALIGLGHDVFVYTNYPRFAAKRFGLPTDRVKSFLGHGLMTRVQRRLDPRRYVNFEPYFHRSFGSWAAGPRASQRRFDLRILRGSERKFCNLSRGAYPCERWIVRGSAHIREQHRLLSEEEVRVGLP